MRSLVTIGSIIAAVVVLFLVPIVMRAEYAGDCQKFVAESEVEKFCAELSAVKQLNILDVETVTKALMGCGYTGEFKITVYTFEEALDGTMHRYAVSWDEILTVLGSEEIFYFPADCYVRIEVPARYERNLMMNIAFGRIGFEHTFIMGSGI